MQLTDSNIFNYTLEEAIATPFRYEGEADVLMDWAIQRYEESGKEIPEFEVFKIMVMLQRL